MKSIWLKVLDEGRAYYRAQEGHDVVVEFEIIEYLDASVIAMGAAIIARRG